MTHSTLERELVDIPNDRPESPTAATSPNPPVPPAAPTGPAEPTEPTERRRGASARTWRNRGVVLLMVAGAAFGTVQLIDHQSAQSAQLSIDSVVLTAQPIEITSAQAGVVTAVAVQAGDAVTAGERVGTVAVTTTDAKGDPETVAQDLRAPSNGVVVTDPSAVGNTLLPGSSFLQMYDPNKLDLVTTVPLTSLAKVRSGMTAVLTAPGVLGSLQATVDRAVPRVGNDQSSVPAGNVQLVLTPRNPKGVANLLPGLRFHGYIDTRTGTNASSKTLYVGGAS